MSATLPERPGGPPESLKIIHGSHGGSAIPTYVAIDGGFYEKYGLQVEYTVISGRAAAITPLVSGEIDIVETGGAAVVSAALAGADIVMVGATTFGLGLVLVTSTSIVDANGLRGKRLGVNRLNDNTYFSAKYALRRLNLDPEQDVIYVALGSQPQQLAGLTSGIVDAGMLNITTYTVAKKEGFKILVNLADHQVPYVTSGTSVTRSFLRDRRNTVLRYLKAKIEATNYAYRNKGPVLEMMRRHMQLDDMEQIEATYDFFVDKLLLRVPYVSEDGIRTVLEEVADETPAAKDANPRDFIDPGVLAEIEASGFIKTLPGR